MYREAPCGRRPQIDFPKPNATSPRGLSVWTAKGSSNHIARAKDLPNRWGKHVDRYPHDGRFPPPVARAITEEIHGGAFPDGGRYTPWPSGCSSGP